jgi:hypothetical protein
LSYQKELDKILEDLHEGWSGTQQVGLFTSETQLYSVLTQACIKYLKYFGYKITEPNKPKYNVQKLDDLIYLFYAFLDNAHPELTNSYRHMDRDRKIASCFLKARKDATGYSTKVALVECAEIIETIFEHEKDFNFRIPLTFGVLGQKNCGWITDKAIQIMNRKKLDEERKQRDKLIAELDDKYDAEPDGFGDLDAILKNLS